MSDWHGYWCLSPVKERARTPDRPPTAAGFFLLSSTFQAFFDCHISPFQRGNLILFIPDCHVIIFFFEACRLFYSRQKGIRFTLRHTRRAPATTLKFFKYYLKKKGNKTKVGNFAHHVCLRLPKGECLNTFFNNPPFAFSPVLFRSKRVDVFDRTRRRICIYCKAVRSRWSTTLVTTKNLNHLFFYYSKDKTFGIQQKRVRFFPILPGRKLRDVFHKFKVEVSRQRMAPLVKWPITICADFRTS